MADSPRRCTERGAAPVPTFPTLPTSPTGPTGLGAPCFDAEAHRGDSIDEEGGFQPDGVLHSNEDQRARHQTGPKRNPHANGLQDQKGGKDEQRSRQKVRKCTHLRDQGIGRSLRNAD